MNQPDIYINVNNIYEVFLDHDLAATHSHCSWIFMTYYVIILGKEQNALLEWNLRQTSKGMSKS